ncbi:MAG: fumarylacetoacetase, partial [Blastocatellia bacterium]|nr:fumarylacetoacetase [Blastocatellia bacterium]
MISLNQTHDPERRSWIESANAPGSHFPIQNLPFGAFTRDGEARTGVAIGEQIVDLHALADAQLVDGDALAACMTASASASGNGTLNELMALEPRYPSALRHALSGLLSRDTPLLGRLRELEKLIQPRMSDVEMRLACDIGDYTDILTSLHHTKRHGRFKC